jgi:tetratricopeptide (TPR) repeat protein
VLAEALATAPNRTDVLVAAGELQQDFGQHEQALGYYRKAADLEPQQADHWLHMARAQVALSFLPAARESIARALELAPDSVDAVGFAVRLDMTEGKGPNALERALALRHRKPNDALAALLEGDVRTALGQHAEAARAYAESVSLHRSLPAVIRLSQARQLAGAGDPLSPLRDWLRDRPEDLAARGMYAIFLDQAGRADAAIAQYEQVLDGGRPDPVMSNNLAMLYLSKGDSRAEALARQAYRLAPTNGAIADTLGWILVKKGSKDEGLRLLREAVAQAPQEPEIGLHLAEALVGADQRAEARQLLEKLLEAHPEFAGRKRAQELLKSASG